MTTTKPPPDVTIAVLRTLNARLNHDLQERDAENARLREEVTRLSAELARRDPVGAITVMPAVTVSVVPVAQPPARPTPIVRSPSSPLGSPRRIIAGGTPVRRTQSIPGPGQPGPSFASAPPAFQLSADTEVVLLPRPPDARRSPDAPTIAIMGGRPQAGATHVPTGVSVFERPVAERRFRPAATAAERTTRELPPGDPSGDDASARFSLLELD